VTEDEGEGEEPEREERPIAEPQKKAATPPSPR
jgi:hypothetical protein